MLLFSGPVFDVPSGFDVYYGHLKETDSIVTVSPKIKIVKESGPVCEFIVTPHEQNGQESKSRSKPEPVPFVVDIEDHYTGQSTIRLKDHVTLDCAEPVLRFDLQAKHCTTGELSQRMTLEVRVEDTNNHKPTFTQDWYAVEVEEGRLYSAIVKVHATDADCGHPYGEICRYQITNNANHFVINNEGVVRNTHPLNYTLSPSHVLSVTATDCGMRQSDPVLVTVTVKRPCKTGLHKVDSELHYDDRQYAMPLLPNAVLHICNDSCKVKRIEGVIRLKAHGFSSSCDREVYSTGKLKKICGADRKTVEFLPSSSAIRTEMANDGASSFSTNSVDEKSEEIFMFDGVQNAVIVPHDVFKPTNIPNKFSLSFWMKHDFSKLRGHLKEHIVCLSDDHRTNRHHFSVYVKHCKLELLIRREQPDATKSEYEPAEWRWHLDEVCDNRWHYYSLNVDFPKVSLYVDGKQYAVKDDPEVLDDWPMHIERKAKTRMVVGACWQGRSQVMAQFFKGFLSGVSYLEGRNEKESVFKCVQRCSEKLDFRGLQELRPEMEVVFDKDFSELQLTARSVADYEHMLRRVSYMNTQTEATKGGRDVEVMTSVRCQSGASILLPTSKLHISTRPPKTPRIKLVLTGRKSLISSQLDVERGINLFSDLNIDVNGASNDHERSAVRLEWCKISARPSLDKEREYFSSPASLIGSLGLDFEHVKDGLFLKGIEKVNSYQSILRQIHYFNSRPNEFAERKFIIQCVTTRGEVKSNELNIRLTINANEVHPVARVGVKKDDYQPAHSEHSQPLLTAGGSEPSANATSNSDYGHYVDKWMVQNKPESQLVHQLTLKKLEMDAPHPPFAAATTSDKISSTTGSTSVNMVVVIIAVMICVLMLFVVFAVMRIRVFKTRGNRKRIPGDDSDLAWDDAGMNITVNPLEEVSENKAHSEEFSDYSCNEDDATDRDEEECSECEEEDILPHVSVNGAQATGLEWDDSTLHNSVSDCSRKHTYRV